MDAKDPTVFMGFALEIDPFPMVYKEGVGLSDPRSHLPAMLCSRAGGEKQAYLEIFPHLPLNLSKP